MVLNVSQPVAAAYRYQTLWEFPTLGKLPQVPISPLSLVAPVVSVASFTSGSDELISNALERLSAPAASTNWMATKFSSNPTTRRVDTIGIRFPTRKRLDMRGSCVIGI